jgi:hypothetical protein
MLTFALVLWQALGLPEAEDPIPDRIGWCHVFALAGAGGVLGEIVGFGLSPAEREWAVRVGNLTGFCFGIGAYCLSLLAQVLSAL